MTWNHQAAGGLVHLILHWRGLGVSVPPSACEPACNLSLFLTSVKLLYTGALLLLGGLWGLLRCWRCCELPRWNQHRSGSISWKWYQSLLNQLRPLPAFKNFPSLLFFWFKFTFGYLVQEGEGGAALIGFSVAGVWCDVMCCCGKGLSLPFEGCSFPNIPSNKLKRSLSPQLCCVYSCH